MRNSSLKLPRYLQDCLPWHAARRNRDNSIFRLLHSQQLAAVKNCASSLNRTALAILREPLVAVVIAVSGAPPALALSTDRDQPITIEANRAEADDARQVTIYRGNVVLDQGTLRITGSTVTIYYDQAGNLAKMVSLGDPARFRQLPDGETEYRKARALRMEYYAKKDLIILLGEAEYGQGADRLAAERIVYDSRRSLVQADSGATGKTKTTAENKQRIRIKIMPRKKNPPGKKQP